LQEVQEEMHKLKEDRDQLQENRDQLKEDRDQLQEVLGETRNKVQFLEEMEERDQYANEYANVKEREELQEERGRLQEVLEEMRSKVECPVCLVVPRAGPVPVCPMGHFICSGCKERRGREGERNCPTCRGPMGEAKSLLASVVIENVMHECNNKDCDTMI
jgi:hypothetical protein